MHAVHERPGTFHTTNDEVVIIASRIRPAYLFPTNQVHQDLSQISILWTLNKNIDSSYKKTHKLMDFPKVCPKEFIVLEELPKLNTGKKPKRVLKKQQMKKIKDDSSKRKIVT